MKTTGILPASNLSALVINRLPTYIVYMHILYVYHKTHNSDQFLDQKKENKVGV